MKYESEWSKISEFMGISEDQVTNHIKKLRKCLKDHGVNFDNEMNTMRYLHQH